LKNGNGGWPNYKRTLEYPKITALEENEAHIPKLSLSSSRKIVKPCILCWIGPQSMQTARGPPGLMPMMLPTANCPPACQKLTGKKFFSGS
jgi:hypothetical protein